MRSRLRPMRLRFAPLLLTLSLLGHGCVPTQPEGEPDPDGGPEDRAYLTQLDTLSSYEDLATEGGVDYFLKVAGAVDTPPILEPCMFIESSEAPDHLSFLNLLSEQPIEGVDYFENAFHSDRVWWSGKLLRRGSDDEAVRIVWGFFSDEDVRIDDVFSVYRVLVDCMSGLQPMLAFSATDSAQQRLTEGNRQRLEDEGIVVYAAGDE